MSLSFYTRKKDEQYTPVNGAYSGSPYSTPTPVPVPTPAPKQTTTSYYTSTSKIPASGYGSQYASTPSTYKIPASGMTSNYALNPSSYQKPVTQTTQTATQNQPQVSSVPTYMNDYLSKIRSLNEQQKASQTSQAEDYASRLSQLRDKSTERTRSIIPQLQQSFGQFSQNVYDQIASQEQQAGEDQRRIKETQGEALRRQAQTNRENQGNLQNLFAGLGTIDSGVFQQQASKQANDFTRTQNETLQAQSDQINQITRDLGNYRRDAQMLIAQEQSNLLSRIAEIENTIDSNSFEYDQAIKNAIDTAQANVNEIDQQMAGIEYGVAQQLYELQQGGGDKLSEAFLTTGQPQTRADYEWTINNSDKYQKAFPNTESQTESGNKVKNIISQLLGMNTEGITGRMRLGWSDESRNAEGLLKQLNAELQVEEAKRLKGQGSMSDAERALLANAVAAFNPDKNGRPQVTNDRFRQILMELGSNFGRSTPNQSNYSSVNNQLVSQYGG